MGTNLVKGKDALTKYLLAPSHKDSSSLFEPAITGIFLLFSGSASPAWMPLYGITNHLLSLMEFYQKSYQQLIYMLQKALCHLLILSTFDTDLHSFLGLQDTHS